MDNINQTPTTIVDPEAVGALREALSPFFFVTATSMDVPAAGHVRFRGYFNVPLSDCFEPLRSKFENLGFTPLIRDDERDVQMIQGQVAVIAMPMVFDPAPSNPIINLVLFIATVLSTLFVGAASSPEYTGPELWLGWRFSLSLLLILGAHEMGHYFAARYHRAPVTLPYFIPLPVSIIGTLGAFIQLKSPVRDKRALFDVGVAGPLAGLLFAIPILIYGLATSEVGPIPTGPHYLEGNSILYALAKLAVLGDIFPANGLDVSLNQVAWAGWIGLFVTGLNLIPVGQLDGGHMAYVLLGQRARIFFWPVLIGMASLALFTAAGLQWGLWVVLIYFIGRRHAVPLDDVTPLDSRRRALAIMTLVIFVLVFVPVPLQLINP